MSKPLVNDARDRVAVRGYLDAHLNRLSYLLQGATATTGKAEKDRAQFRAEIDRLLQTRRDLCGDAG